MAESNCPGCAEPFRKGRTVNLLQGDGQLVRKRVCPGCARNALKIVPVLVAARPQVNLVRSAQLEALARRLRTMSVAARGVLESYVRERSARGGSPTGAYSNEAHTCGQIDALEQVIALVDEARAGRPL